jgi:hypothetical protein
VLACFSSIGRMAAFSGEPILARLLHTGRVAHRRKSCPYSWFQSRRGPHSGAMGLSAPFGSLKTFPSATRGVCATVEGRPRKTHRPFQSPGREQ